jgi:hypothetical protein
VNSPIDQRNNDWTVHGITGAIHDDITGNDSGADHAFVFHTHREGARGVLNNEFVEVERPFEIFVGS